MINRIIDFSVNNRFMVFVLAAAACMGGWWSIKHLRDARRHVITRGNLLLDA